MKGLRFVRILSITLSLFVLFCTSVSAQNVRNRVESLSAKYKDEKGVMCMTCDDGVQLKAVRAILRKEFGEEFANGVEAFTIIFYKDAVAENSNKIVGEIGEITQTLQEVDITNKLKANTKASGYIRLSEDKQSITDLIIVVDAPSPKLIYLGGKFKTEKI